MREFTKYFQVDVELQVLRGFTASAADQRHQIRNFWNGSFCLVLKTALRFNRIIAIAIVFIFCIKIIIIIIENLPSFLHQVMQYLYNISLTIHIIIIIIVNLSHFRWCNTCTTAQPRSFPSKPETSSSSWLPPTSSRSSSAFQRLISSSSSPPHPFHPQLDGLLHFCEVRCASLIDLDTIVSYYIHAKVGLVFNLQQILRDFLHICWKLKRKWIKLKRENWGWRRWKNIWLDKWLVGSLSSCILQYL